MLAMDIRPDDGILQQVRACVCAWLHRFDVRRVSHRRVSRLSCLLSSSRASGPHKTAARRTFSRVRRRVKVSSTTQALIESLAFRVSVFLSSLQFVCDDSCEQDLDLRLVMYDVMSDMSKVCNFTDIL